jgi:hypothetical protein
MEALKIIILFKINTYFAGLMLEERFKKYNNLVPHQNNIVCIFKIDGFAI